MTTQQDIDDAIQFELTLPRPAWWDSASDEDRREYLARKERRIEELRRTKPDGITQYPAGGALDDGPS